MNIPNTRPDYAAEILTALPVDYRHMTEAVDKFEERQSDLPATVESDADDKRVSDFIADMRSTLKNLEGSRIDEKDRFLRAERAVDGHFNPLKTRLTNIATRLNARLTAYKVAKENAERRKREEAAARERAEAERLRKLEEERTRKAEEARRADHAAKHNEAADDAAYKAQEHEQKADALEVQAAAPMKEVTSVRSDRGTLSGLAYEWIGTVEDYAAVDLAMLRPYLSQAEIDRAVKAFVRAGGRQLAGVKIVEVPKARVR